MLMTANDLATPNNPVLFQAQIEPVFITNQGDIQNVVLSFELFQALLGNADISKLIKKNKEPTKFKSLLEAVNEYDGEDFDFDFSKIRDKSLPDMDGFK